MAPPTSSAFQTAGWEDPSAKVKRSAEATDAPFAAVEELRAVLTQNNVLLLSVIAVKDCRRPKEQPNMTMSDFNNTLYGAEIEVSCKEG